MPSGVGANLDVQMSISGSIFKGVLKYSYNPPVITSVVAGAVPAYNLTVCPSGICPSTSPYSPESGQLITIKARAPIPCVAVRIGSDGTLPLCRGGILATGPRSVPT